MDKQAAWFGTLYAWVKTRDSCQPEQAIEPSATMFEPQLSENNSSLDESINSTTYNPQPESGTKKLFVPTRGGGRKRKAEEDSSIIGSFREISEQTTKTMVEFFERENVKDRGHEEKLFQMLLLPQQYLQMLQEQQQQD